jgi:hypothetical protein
LLQAAARRAKSPVVCIPYDTVRSSMLTLPQVLKIR